MYQGHWASAVLSRAAAVIVLCLLAAFLAGKVGEFEVAETEKMTHQELKEYVREGANTPFIERYLIILVSAVVFVALVEGLAAGFRAVVPSGSNSSTSVPSYP